MNKNSKPNSPSSASVKRKASFRTSPKPLDKESNRAGGKTTQPTKPKTAKSFKEIQSVHIESNDVSIDQELEDQMIIQETSEIRLELLQSLQAFRTANKEMFSQNLELKQEVDEFSKDFMGVKAEVAGMLWESCKSREGMRKMKDMIGRPKAVLDIDLSSVKDVDEEALVRTLRDLQEKMEDIREQITSNEEEIKSRESLNSELRNAVYRIRDSVMTTPVLLNESNEQKCCKII